MKKIACIVFCVLLLFTMSLAGCSGGEEVSSNSSAVTTSGETSNSANLSKSSAAVTSSMESSSIKTSSIESNPEESSSMEDSSSMESSPEESSYEESSYEESGNEEPSESDSENVSFQPLDWTDGAMSISCYLPGDNEKYYPSYYFVWEKITNFNEYDGIITSKVSNTPYYDKFYEDYYNGAIQSAAVNQGTVITVDFGENGPKNVRLYRDTCTYDSAVQVRVPELITVDYGSGNKFSFSADFGTEQVVYYHIVFDWGNYFAASAAISLQKY